MEAEERPSKLRKLSHDHERASDEHVARSENANVLDAAQDVTSTSDAANTDAQAVGVDKTSAHIENPSGNQTPAPAASNDPPLSKNQLKKLRKKQEWEAGRDLRKARRRDKTKEKKARRRAEKQESQDPSSTPQNGSTRPAVRRRHYRLPVTFVIDCGFDDLMVEKERISLGSQLTIAYSDNNKAEFQAHLYVSSWGGELKKRFEGPLLRGMYRNWRNVKFVEEDFVGAARMANEIMSGKRGGSMLGAFQSYATMKEEQDTNGMAINTSEKTPLNGAADGATEMAPASSTDAQTTGSLELGQEASADFTNKTNGTAHTTSTKEQSPPKPYQVRANSTNTENTSQQPTKGEIIYLTSDSPYTLTDLKPYHTYIIGGLVDKNKHKGICYKTARDMGIKTAKLPIGEYMQMTSRFVLATSHVVEIMVRWLECGDWGKAFLQVMPKRKGGVLRTDVGKGEEEGHEIEGTDAGGDNDEEEEEEEVECDIGDQLDAEDGGSAGSAGNSSSEPDSGPE